MNENDKQLVSDFFIYGKISEAEFIKKYSGDLSKKSDHFSELLQEAMSSKDKSIYDAAMFIGSYFKLWKDNLIDLFNDLLLEEWHFDHENIVNALQSTKNPKSIDALYLTAAKDFEYLNYDDEFALARKCTWALADINTPESIQKLKLLAKSTNPYIKSYSEKRLANLK